MADPTTPPRPNHQLQVKEDVATTPSTLHGDDTATDTKSGNIFTSDDDVPSNPNETGTGVTEASPQTGETAHVDSAAVQQYEDLVSKVAKLESMLARVDKVVQKELVDGDPGIDEMSNIEDEGFIIEEELREYMRQQNATLRESNYLYRSMRQLNSIKRNRMRLPAERMMPENEATVDTEAELRATKEARLAEMLANGIPATGLRTTWAHFQSASPHSNTEWQFERRKESIINPFELLVGEPESTLLGSRERKPAPRSIPVNTADFRAPGEVPLPERIIFHSSELIGVLNSILAGDNSFFGAPPPGYLLGILRPFKMLVYYEKRLRDYAASLETEEPDAVSEGGPVATLSDDVGGVRTSDTGRENNNSQEGSTEQNSDNSVRLLHTRCLLDFIENEVNARNEYLNSGRCQKITFSDLWYLFQPGFEVIDQDNKQAYRVASVMMPSHETISQWERFRNFNHENGGENLEKSAKIHCIYIDFDGEEIGPVTKTFEIPRFDQEKMIEALPIYPLRMVREDGFRDRLAERGKMLWTVIQVKPMYYTGHTIDTREEVDSQVMIDFSEALIHASENGKEWKPQVNFIPLSFEEGTDRVQRYCRAMCCWAQVTHDDSYVEVRQTEEFIKSQLERNTGERPSLMIYPQTIREILETSSIPNRDELVLMSYRAFGFILRSRKWAQLDLTYMKYENEANRTNVLSAFDQLILPKGHKEMVQSLVTQHFREKRVKEKIAVMKEPDAKTDLIRGKGQGLIILLHGAPGVGKTTTAEGIAETFKKPLFQITSGDLGTTASDVQWELEKNFTLASRWDCILLLDEAEVFLASRDRKDFQRNGLVAVFLRVLEYYTGILFLTTNRVGDFDEAFASRIHMSLHYPKLDLEKTLEIFRVNMQLINDKFKIQNRKIFLDEESIIEFARKHFEQNDSDDHQGLLWNGRQIRNACQTALAMAEFEALDSNLSDEIEPSPMVQLKLKHFQTIEAAYNDFATYLGETYGMTQDERMAVGHVRAEELPSPTTKKKGSNARSGGKSVQR